MAGRRISWEDVDLRVYIDGDEKGRYFATRLSWNEDPEVDSAKAQGASTPSLDGHYNGGRGSITWMLQAGFDDPTPIFEEQKGHFKDRTPGGEVRIVASHKQPNAQVREARRFDNCILSMGLEGNENRGLSLTTSFQFENSERIT